MGGIDLQEVILVFRIYLNNLINEISFSPDGKKIRSKPQLARLLGETFDLSAFDFRTGRIIYSAVRKSKRQKGSPFDFARGKPLACH